MLQVNAIFEKLNSQGKFPEGVSAAVSGVDSSVLQELAARNPGKLYVAIDNCPHQVVLSGTEDSMAEAMERLRERRAICQTLPFTRAYHTPGFETFSDALRAYFGGLDIQDQVVDVYSCVIADRYPKQADEIRSLASLQWARPVRFRETIERMYQDGVRIFVEVGPRGNLIAFINDTLRGKEFTAIPADVLHRSGTLQLNHLVAELAAQGVSMSLEPLYARRSPRRLETGSILGIPGREQPASSKDVHLATGLQPLRLPADFTASKTPPAVSARTTAGQSPDQQPTPAIRPSAAGRRPGSLPSRRARSASPKPASTKKTSSRVMEQHLHTMEEFLKTQEQVMQGFLRRKKNASGTLPAGSPRSGRVEESPQTQNLPFIDSIVEHIPGRSVTATCRIDLTEDVLFKHHTLGRDVSLQDPSLLALPVVPLTITMEILAQGGSLLQPEKLLVGMRNLRAYRWITLEEPHLLLEISAQLNSRTSGGVDVSVRQLVDDRAAAPVLAEGIMLFAGGYRKAPPAERFGLQEEAPSRWTSDQLYREGMFHGPCFQAVKSVARTGRDGNTTTLQVPPRDNLFATKAPTFLTDAVILDAAGQALAFWTQEEFEESTDIFPYRLESLELFGPLLEPGTEFECRVRARTMGENQLSSDIDIVDKAGSVYYRLVGWEDRRFDIPKEFLGLRISPPESNLSAPWELPLVGEDSISELTCCYVDQLSEEFLEAHTGIWGKVLKHLILGKKEREYLAALKGPPKRLREWLLGRAAAKDAVRLLLDRQFGLRLCPADIEVIPDSAGRPRVGGGWTSQVGRPVVSISHSGGVAVALATMNQDRLVGIDIECLSRPAEGFERIAFTQREQELLSSLEGENRQEWLLRFWCAKEALLKALGQGFSDGLQAVGVRSAEFDKGVVTLSIGDGLMEEFEALRGKEVPTYTIRQEDFITSVVFHPQGAES